MGSSGGDLAMLKPRKFSFKTRKEGLKKKIRELTTLCDAQACMLIFHPNQTETTHHQPQPEIWPEKLEDFNKVITRYNNTTSSSSSGNQNDAQQQQEEEDTSVAVFKKMHNNNNNNSNFNLEACSKQQLQDILQKIDFNIEIVNQMLNPPPPLDQVVPLLDSSDYDYDYDFGNCYFSDSARDYSTMAAAATDSLVNFMC